MLFHYAGCCYSESSINSLFFVNFEICSRYPCCIFSYFISTNFWNGSFDSLSGEKATEMRCFQKDSGHLLKRRRHKNEEVQNRAKKSDRALREPSLHRQKEETPVVRTRDTINRTFKNTPAGNSPSRYEKRQTENKMGGQYPGVDRPGLDWHIEEGRESAGMERELVARSSAVPLRSIRLRDRCGEVISV